MAAGHQEVIGETIAMTEFYYAGFNPFSRFLDEDKVDLVLRFSHDGVVRYAEIQVKYGRLYDCTPAWEKKLFSTGTWRFFKHNEFIDHRDSLFVAYVMDHPEENYSDDIFIFPSKKFHEFISQPPSVQSRDQKKWKVCITKAHDGDWYLRSTRKFEKLGSPNSINVTKYRRNFDQIRQAVDALPAP